MTARDDQRLIGTDVIGVLRRRDRVQRGLNTCKLALQLNESCVLVNNFLLEPLAFGLQLLDLLPDDCKVAVSQIQAEHVAPDCAPYHENHNGEDQQKLAPSCGQQDVQSRDFLVRSEEHTSELQ